MLLYPPMIGFASARRAASARRMIGFASIGRAAFACALVAALGAISGCGGSTVPAEVAGSGGGDGGPVSADLQPLDVTMVGFVGGDVGDGSSSGLSGGRGWQSSSATTVGGTVVAGANGVDLKDLGWGNLFTQGLSSAPFPTGTQLQIRLFTEGATAPIATIGGVGADGLFNSTVNAQALRTGGRLELEMAVNGQISRIRLPVLTLSHQDQIGFNAIRRQNGSLVVELFADALNNTTLLPGPDGRADNGIRIVVDSGVDLDGDGLPETAARMDTADGLSFFDLNLDGRFGDPEADSLVYVDANGTGFADTPLMLASEAAATSLNLAETVSFIYDPELDGIRERIENRSIGDGTESDAIASMSVVLTPASLPANGINSGTVSVIAKPTAKSFHLNAPVTFQLQRTGGTLLSEQGEARFQSSGSTIAQRILSPADPEVRLLSDGSMVLNESVLTPMLNPASLVNETGEPISASLTITVATGERLASSPAVGDTKTLALTANNAPILTSVLVAGQQDVTGVTGGLEIISRAAVLTWGARVRVIGQNFANNVAANSVAVGGTPVSNLTVNSTGTELEFDIPEGAETGPVSVLVGGLGGITSQNLVIAGPRLEAIQISPASENGTIPANSSFTLTMSRDVDAESVHDSSLFLRQVGASSLGWSVSLADPRTLRLAHNEGASMSPGLSYELVMTSELRAADTDPQVGFDPQINIPLGDGVETAVLLTFEAVTEDIVPPALLSSIPADQASAVDPRAPITLQFDEALTPTSVAAAVSTGALRIVAGESEELVAVEWALADGGKRIELRAIGSAPFAGLTDFRVIHIEDPNQGDSVSAPVTDEVSFSALTDVAGNFAPAFQIAFRTSIGVGEPSPRSGPVASRVRVDGSGFARAEGGVTVRLGGVLINTVDVLDDETLEFEVPAGAAGGAVVIAAESTERAALAPFTVTLNLQRVNLPGLAGSRPIGVAVSADDRLAFLSNQGTGNVSVFDLDTLELVDSDGIAENGMTRVQLGSVPSEATMTRDGRRLLSLDYGTPEVPGDSFFVVGSSVVDGSPRFAVEATVSVGRRPTRIVTSPDGRRWYVTNFLSDTLSVISAEAPFQVVATVPTGKGPNGVEISPDGTRGYVCNYLEGTVSVLDMVGNGVVGTVRVGIGPARARVSPDGRWVYVTCNEDSTMHVIDTANNRNVLTVTSPASPSAMVFSRSGNRLFVCSRVQDVVAVYTITEVEGVPFLGQPSFIQAGRIPAGLAVTRDGSRLIIANEGEGNASVVWLQPPVQTIFDIRFEASDQTRSADEGQLIEILGAGFEPDAGLNAVSFGGVIATPEAADRERLLVRVPDGALSGPLTVQIGDKLSNAIDFLVTPRILRVTRITPANGSVGVRAETAIVCRCNEPVRGGAGDWLVERLLDTFTDGERDVDPNPITGTVIQRDFDHEMVFRPSQPLIQTPNSNNFYRITVRQSLDDRAGNTLERDVVTRFQLADSRGPTLLRAVLIDVDNNGVDVGDVLTLVFDEEVSSRGQLPAAVANLITFNDGSLLGTGATIQFPTLAALERSSPITQLDPFSRTMMIRLGADPAILVPGTRTAITGLTNYEGDLALRDASGNTALSLVSASVDVEFFVNEVTSPRALSAVLMDTNLNGIADAGEEIGIYCNTPLTMVGALDTSMFQLGGAGSTFGTGTVIDQYPHNHRVIRITLGPGAMIDFNDPNRTIAAPNALASLVNFADVPLAAWAGTDIRYTIGTPTEGPLIDTSVPNPVVFDDLDGNGLDAGDVIRVLFDRPLVVGNAPAGICFVLPVAGNSFGIGARVRNSEDESLSPEVRSRTCEIILGPNANILPAGVGTSTATTFGAPSTLVVNPTIPLWAVADEFGLSARPDPLGTVFDIASSDTTPPLLREAVFVDANADGEANQGDQLLLVFDETVRRNGATLAGFFPTDGVTTYTFGTGATLSVGQSRAVSGANIPDNVLVITLGANPTVPLTIGVSIEVAPSNPAADVSGNTLTPGDRGSLRFTLPAVPKLLSATVIDVGNDGIGETDRLYLKFDQPMVLGTTDPAALFSFAVPSDSFGSGATAAPATVTAELIAAGLTTNAIGTTDRTVVTVTLGVAARISRVSGASPTVPTFRYSTGIGAIVSPGTSSSIGIRPLTALGFTRAQLALAFDDATRFGATASFNGISFRPSAAADALPPFFFSLPGARTAFTGTTGDFAALVSTLNGAFIESNLRLRAFHNAIHDELVVADHGEGLIGSGGGFEATGDVATPAIGNTVLGLDAGITNAVGLAPIGTVDIVGVASTAPLLVLSAVHDAVTGAIDITFSKPVEFPLPRPADQVFQMLVTSDRFGTGATVEQVFPTTLRITLGANATLRADGIFLPALTIAGSPSGVRVRPTISASLLADSAGNLPSTLPIDITGGTLPPASGLSIAAHGGLPATAAIGGGQLRAMAFSAAAVSSTSPIVLNSLNFGVTVTTTDARNIFVNAVLYEDMDGNRALSAGDVPLMALSPSASGMFFISPIGSRQIGQTAVNFLLVLETVPDPLLDGVSMSISLTDLTATDVTAQTSAQVETLPLNGGLCIFRDTRNLAAANGGLAMTFGATATDPSNGRTAAASASITQRREVFMTMTAAQIENAISVSNPGPLTDVSLDLDGDGFADVYIFSTTRSNFDGALDTPAERADLVAEINDAIPFSSVAYWTSTIRAELGPLGSINFVAESRGRNGWQNRLIEARGQHGGFLFGGSVINDTYSSIVTSNFSPWPDPVGVIMGGRDASNALTNTTRVLWDRHDDDDPIVDIPVEGNVSWSPREGHMAVSVFEEVYLLGGRDGGAAFGDMHRMTAENDLALAIASGSIDHGSPRTAPTRLRWEPISTTGASPIHSGVAVYIHESPAVRRSIVVVTGATNAASTAMNLTVRAFSLETRTWTTLTRSATSDPIIGRWGATGGMLGGNRLVVFGGRTGPAATDTTSAVQVFDFGASPSSVHVSTPTPDTGSAWIGGFRATSFAGGSHLAVFGGRAADSTLPNGGALLTLTRSGAVQWRALGTWGLDEFVIPGREGACIVESYDTFLAFGTGVGGVSSEIFGIESGLVGSDIGESGDGPRILMAYQLPKEAGTPASEEGDRIVVVLSDGAAWLDRYPSGELSDEDINDEFALSTALSLRISFPSGTTGLITRTLSEGDTVVITLGGGVSILESPGALIGFDEGEGPSTTRVTIAGSSDAEKTFVWTGNESSNWFDAANWYVNGITATTSPDVGDVVIISAAASGPAVIPADYFPPTVGLSVDAVTDSHGVDAHQLIVHGGRLLANRSLSLSGVGHGIFQAYGSIEFAPLDGVRLELGGGTSSDPVPLTLFGQNRFTTIEAPSGNLRLTGRAIVTRDISMGSGPLEGDGEDSELFITGANDSTITGSLLAVRHFIMFKDSPTTTVDVSGMSMWLQAHDELSLGRGNLMTGTKPLYGYDIEIFTDATITGQTGSEVALFGVGASLRAENAILPGLRVHSGLHEQVKNSSFGSGFEHWSGDGVDLSPLGYDGSDSVTVTSPFQASLDQYLDPPAFYSGESLEGHEEVILSAWVFVPSAAISADPVVRANIAFYQPLAGPKSDQPSREFRFGSEDADGWKHITYRFQLSSLLEYGSRIEFTFENALGLRIDNIQIMGAATVSGSLTVNGPVLLDNSATDVVVNDGELVTLGGSVQQVRGSRLRFIGTGAVHMPQLETAASGNSIQFIGIDADNPLQVTLPSSISRPTTSGRVDVIGRFAASNTEFTPANGGVAQLQMSGHGTLSLTDSALTNTALVVESTATSNPGMSLNSVVFQGTPPLGRVSGNTTNPTFITIDAPSFTESFTNRISIRDMVFVGAQGSVRSIEAPATASGPGLIQVRGALSGTGFLSAASEHDLSGVVSDAANTGAIRWVDVDTVRVTYPNPSERFVSPPASNVVIGEIELLATKATTLTSLVFRLRLNTESADIPAFSSLTLTNPSASPQQVAQWIGASSSADPIAIFPGPITLAPGNNLLQIRANFTSEGNFPGAQARVLYLGATSANQDFQSVVWPPKLDEDLPYSLGLSPEAPLARSLVGIVTVGTPLTPVVTSVLTNPQDPFPGFGTPVQIFGRNLARQPDQILAVTPTGFELSDDYAWVDATGTRILNIFFDHSQSATLPFDGSISIRYTHSGSTPERVFRFRETRLGMIEKIQDPFAQFGFVQGGSGILNFSFIATQSDHLTYVASYEYSLDGITWLPARGVGDGPTTNSAAITTDAFGIMHTINWDTGFPLGQGLALTTPLNDVHFRMRLHNAATGTSTLASAILPSVNNTTPVSNPLESTLTAGRVYAQVAQQVTVPITLRSGTGHQSVAMQLVVGFDETRLQFVSANTPLPVAGVTPFAGPTSASREMVLTNNSQVIPDGTVINLVFNVLPGPSNVTVPITVGSVILVSPLSQSLSPVAGINGAVHIE